MAQMLSQESENTEQQIQIGEVTSIADFSGSDGVVSSTSDPTVTLPPFETLDVLSGVSPNNSSHLIGTISSNVNLLDLEIKQEELSSEEIVESLLSDLISCVVSVGGVKTSGSVLLGARTGQIPVVEIATLDVLSVLDESNLSRFSFKVPSEKKNPASRQKVCVKNRETSEKKNSAPRQKVGVKNREPSEKKNPAPRQKVSVKNREPSEKKSSAPRQTVSVKNREPSEKKNPAPQQKVSVKNREPSEKKNPAPRQKVSVKNRGPSEKKSSAPRQKIRERNRGARVTCKTCQKTFRDNYHLRRHMATHEKKLVEVTVKTYKCLKCKETYPTERRYQHHLQQVHGAEKTAKLASPKASNQFVCNVCHQSKFTSYGSLKLHIKARHPSIHSDYTTQRKQIQKKIVPKPGIKGKVSKVSKRPASAEVSSTGVDSELSCDQCSKCFTASRALMAHRMSAHNIKPPKTGASIKAMLADVSSTDDRDKRKGRMAEKRSPADNKGIKCPYCREMCQFSWNLQRHLRVCPVRISKESKPAKKVEKQTLSSLAKRSPQVIPKTLSRGRPRKYDRDEPPAKKSPYVSKSTPSRYFASETDEENEAPNAFKVETNLGRRIRKETPKMRELREERERSRGEHSNSVASTPVSHKPARIPAPRRIEKPPVKISTPVVPPPGNTVLPPCNTVLPPAFSPPLPKIVNVTGSQPAASPTASPEKFQEDLMCHVCKKMCINSHILKQHLKLVHKSQPMGVKGVVTASNKKTKVNLRHHLPVGMTYPDSVTISGNGQPSSVAMLKECKRLERLYGRPVVRCGKLDFMIRAIEPQLKPTTPRSVLKQRKVKKELLTPQTMEPLTPITPSSTKSVAASVPDNEATVVVPRRRRFETVVENGKVKGRRLTTSTPHAKAGGRSPTKSPGSSPVKGPAAKFDVSDWPSDDDDEDMIDTSVVSKKPAVIKVAKKVSKAALQKQMIEDSLIPRKVITRRLVAPTVSYEPLMCHLCPYKTRLEPKLDQHKSLHELNPSYQCNECHALFSEEKFLVIHNDLAHIGLTEDEMVRRKTKLERRIKKEEPVFIVTDRQSTGDKETLIFKRGTKKMYTKRLKSGEIVTLRTKDEHTKRDRLPAEIKACLQCGEVITEELKLSRHITAVHKEVNSEFVFREHDLICKACQFTTDALSVMQVHVQMHLMNLEYQCRECFALFLKEEHLARHSTQCPKSEDNERAAAEDYKMMIYREENRCSICSRAFKSRKLLVNHLRTIHNVDVIRTKRAAENDDSGWEDYFTDDSDTFDDLDDMLQQVYSEEQGSQETKEQPASTDVAMETSTTTTSTPAAEQRDSTVKILPIQKQNNEKSPDGDDGSRQCRMCSMLFTDTAKLKSHMMVTHLMKHECGDCDVVCTTMHELHKHIKVEHKRYACSFCPYTARNSTCLAAHERHHIKSNSESCSLCPGDIMYNNFAMLELHYKTQHNIEVIESSLSAVSRTVFYACCVCTYESCDVDDFDGHQAEHARKIKFKCKLCDKIFLKRFSAAQHQKRVHAEEISRLEPNSDESAKGMPESEASAPIETLQTADAIAEAMNGNGKETESEGQADTTAEGEINLKYFQEINEYVCDQCPKIFDKYFALKRHQTKAHMPVKDTVKPSQTEESPKAVVAGDKVHLRSLLTQPLVQMGGDAQHVVAPVTAAEPLIMDTSMPLLADDSTVPAEPKDDPMHFTCDECPKSFTKLFALQQHRKKIHHRVITNDEDGAYSCEICSKSFRQKFALHQHKKKSHPDNLPEFVFDEKKGRLFLSSELPPPKKRKRVTHTIKEEKTENPPESPIITGPRKRKCRLCAEKFSDSMSMMRHIRLDHSKMDTDDPEEMSSEDEAQDIEYRCTICDFKTDSPRIFSAHEQSHREQPTTLYECALCSVKFTLLENLNKHYIRVHNQKIDNPAELSSQHTQPPSKPTCWLCPFQAFSKEMYQQHMKEQHDLEKACNLCYFTAESIKQLDWHVTKHRQGAKLSCRFCFHLFYESRALDVHVSKVHGPQPETAGDIAESAHNTTNLPEQTSEQTPGVLHNPELDAAMAAVAGVPGDSSSTPLSNDEIRQLAVLEQALGQIEGPKTEKTETEQQLVGEPVEQIQQQVAENVGDGVVPPTFVGEDGQPIDMAAVTEQLGYNQGAGNVVYVNEAGEVVGQGAADGQFIPQQMLDPNTQVMQDAEGNTVVMDGNQIIQQEPLEGQMLEGQPEALEGQVGQEVGQAGDAGLQYVENAVYQTGEGHTDVIYQNPDGTQFIIDANGQQHQVVVDMSGQEAAPEEGGVLVEGGVPAEGGVLVEGGVPVEGGVLVEGGVPVEGGVLVEGGVPVEGGVLVDGGAPVEGGVLVEGGVPMEGDQTVEGEMQVEHMET